MASGNQLIGENRLDARLFAETLPRDAWEADVGVDLGFIQNLVAVHRLREVMCLYGFTRFEAAPTSSDGDIEDVRLAVDGAPLGLATDWLPAIEQFGEGLFIHVDPDAIGAGLRASPFRRLERSTRRHATWAQAKYGTHAPEHPGAAYILLHTLSHALITEIALDCGYPASSLKERVYALSDPGNPGQRDPLRHPDLHRYGRQLRHAGRPGRDGAALCSYSCCCAAVACRFAPTTLSAPIMTRVNRTDDRALHGAACHGCLLIAETSCEMRNVFLDRALIVETMANGGASLFS